MFERLDAWTSSTGTHLHRTPMLLMHAGCDRADINDAIGEFIKLAMRQTGGVDVINHSEW